MSYKADCLGDIMTLASCLSGRGNLALSVSAVGDTNSNARVLLGGARNTMTGQRLGMLFDHFI